MTKLPFNHQAHKAAHDDDGGVRVYGPFTVDYTQFGTVGDSVTLWVPESEDVFLNAFFDPRTATDFDCDPSGLVLTQDDDAGTVQLYGLPSGGLLGGSGDAQGQAPAGNATGGSVWGFYYLPQYVFNGNPLYVTLTGGTTPTTGHYDLYVLTGTPETP